MSQLKHHPNWEILLGDFTYGREKTGGEELLDRGRISGAGVKLEE